MNEQDVCCGYGSGLIGCLFDYGPNFAPSVEDAIDSFVWLFGDSLAEGEEGRLRLNLIQDRIHYFEDRASAGADYCQVWEADIAELESEQA